ncbi:hypothetical protein CRG98_046791 [Punica granatum]|uniref:Alpha/beta hydrolase fold-3 domain-containing protein n=2 Tax=Punica granatum TaxID=22663 RepID=A0A2I0HM93_PUNGR|nr:hypothetical protein CRG98_046791 [Punica granatum]
MGTAAPHVVEDCLGLIRLYSDGSIWRQKPEVVSSLFPEIADDTVVFEDCTYDPHHGLSFRLYRPKSASLGRPLPLILYIHGGGFCLGSPRSNFSHNPCLRLTSGLEVVVVSLDYRLTPEHRLPAAIEDTLGAVEWIRGQAGSGDGRWSGVDFERVFVAGDSAGGNLAHHLAVRLGLGSAAAAPMRTRGFVLMSPFFGGVARTQSEERPSDPVLNLEGADR